MFNLHPGASTSWKAQHHPTTPILLEGETVDLTFALASESRKCPLPWLRWLKSPLNLGSHPSCTAPQLLLCDLVLVNEPLQASRFFAYKMGTIIPHLKYCCDSKMRRSLETQGGAAVMMLTQAHI